jgi:glycosyltransferase involved in cell wall biosynthesis
MRIAIDASSLAVPYKTGVAKYVLRLIEHLEAAGEKNEYLACYRLSRWKKREHFYRPTGKRNKVKLFQEPFFFAGGIDIFHGPDARLPAIDGPKLVATIHDVFSLVSEDFADEKFRKKKIARYTDIAERADIIICDSKSTRSDFLHHFPEAEPKIRVVYLGIDDIFNPRPSGEIERVKQKYGIGADYVFYVGALSIRKNLLRMFEAFLRARERLGGNLQFVVAGRLTYGKEQILEYVQRNDCDSQILMPGYVPDEDMPALYSGAKAFLFATQYEGFGLPVLEAAACGAPVVTSNISSTAEIAKGIALLVDPLNVEEIADALLQALASGRSTGDGPHSDLPKRQWSDMARDVLAIYEELIGESGK